MRTEKEKFAPENLATLIEGELLARTPSFDTPGIRPWVSAVADCIGSLRQIDKIVRAGQFTPDEARAFIQSIRRLSHALRYFDHNTQRESLAADVVLGAVTTATQTFPELLAESP